MQTDDANPCSGLKKTLVQFQVFQSAVLLQSLGKHLAVNNHRRSQDVLVPPSQPASKIEMFSFSNH